MSDDSLDTLLARLNAGDADALEQVITYYEPYLRMVVRRQLNAAHRAKFDSVDIVQSVWADVLDGVREARWNFENTGQLRAFLTRVVRNRFVDRVRQNKTALQMEGAGQRVEVDELPAVVHRASETVHADDLWSQMLAACPEAHYEILHLKRRGATLAEIARQTGLHESSVRRILYQIAKDVSRIRRRDESSEWHSSREFLN